jgi:hypothetical protein
MGECRISCLVTLVTKERVYTSYLRVSYHKSQSSLQFQQEMGFLSILLLTTSLLANKNKNEKYKGRFCDQNRNESGTWARLSVKSSFCIC